MSYNTVPADAFGLSLTRVVGSLAVTCALAVAPLLVLETSTATAAEASVAAPADVDGQRPVYAHMPDPTPAEIQKRIDAGWATGAFLYYPSSEVFNWTPKWDALQAQFPKGIDLFVSPKNFTTASLTNWAEHLSPAQRERTVFAYWQEPEDNFLTDAARAQFRAKVAEAADVLRPYGIRNGIEMQAWTLNPLNKTAWGGADNFKAFLPDDPADLDYVGISLYDYNQNFSGKTQLKPVKNLLDAEVPDAGWGPVASGWSIPVGTPAEDPIRKVRADAAADAFAYAKRVGADSYGWFDFPGWDGTKDYGMDRWILPVLQAL